LLIKIVHRGESALKITEDMDATGLVVFVAPELYRRQPKTPPVGNLHT